MMSPDQLLRDRGWAVTITGYGYLEGPKWWKASASPMGCIAGRQVVIDRAPSFRKAMEMLEAAIEDPEHSSDRQWTREDIEKAISNHESELSHLKWALNRREKGLDIFGIQRDPDEGRS
jgi:hypothetical protein